MSNPPRTIRFGAFEVDLRSAELRKSGMRIHLADQPFQVLTLLLENPGELVTRDELRQRLWSSDTFVDFENGLNAAVKRLREALGDSAESPRFVETVPRHGYRFIAPVIGRETEKPVKPKPKRTQLWAAIGIGMAIILAVGGWLTYRALGSDKPDEVRQAIAVLPFEDMSPERDQEYLSDGLADEVLTALSRIPELRVSARTSSFQFKGKNEDLKVIARKLNVGWLLEGGVRKSGNRIRITVQLINATTGFHLWSEGYDRDLTDIFALQEEIASAVAESLEISLLGQRETKTKRDVNGEAYNAFLQGRYFSERRSRPDIERSIGYFEKALKLDPEFARAWAGLAMVRTHQADSGYISVEEGYGKARVAAERALQLDPNLAEAHTTMGIIRRSHDWDWAGAEASFQRALALAPGDASAKWNAATLAYTLARYDEAIGLNQKAVELDPLDTTGYLNLGVVNYYAGHLKEAEEALLKSLEINRDFPVARAYLTRVYLMKKRNDEALKMAGEETEEAWRLYALALANHALGKKRESDEALTQLIEKYQGTYAIQIADVYGYRGERDKAFEWLDRSYEQRDPGLTEIKNNPLLKGLQDDSRYAAMLKKLNLS